MKAGWQDPDRFWAALDRPDMAEVDHRLGHVQLAGGPQLGEQHLVQA